MTEKILNNNQVVVAGEIVSDFRFSHEIFGEGFYMVDLVVSRLSDAHDVIPLMVSDRLFDVEKIPHRGKGTGEGTVPVVQQARGEQEPFDPVCVCT